MDEIQFQLKWNKNNGHFIHRSGPFFQSIPLSPAATMREHWSCHGSEIMIIPFINFADGTS
jgi:hypothetical protein